MVHVTVKNVVCFTLQHSIIGPNDLLYFADICAGPGGFTEYMLYRTKWHAKGYGFTLKGEHTTEYLRMSTHWDPMLV